MSAGAIIFARLNGATGAANRIFPVVVPQSPTYPCIAYRQISGVRLNHGFTKDHEVTRVRVQVSIWAKTHAEAHDVAREAQIQLSRFRGTVGPHRVHDILLDNELEQIDPDTLNRRVIQEYTLFLS